MFVVPQFVTSWWAFVWHFQSWHFVLRLLPPFPVLTDYTGSEENIDISVLGLPSKLNFPLKTPPSHNHKPEAYPSRPGYGYSEQIHVDGGYLYDGVCVCVCISLCVWLYMASSPLHSSPSDSIHHVVCWLWSVSHPVSVSKCCCSKHIMTCRIKPPAVNRWGHLYLHLVDWILSSLLLQLALSCNPQIFIKTQCKTCCAVREYKLSYS